MAGGADATIRVDLTLQDFATRTLREFGATMSSVGKDISATLGRTTQSVDKLETSTAELGSQSKASLGAVAQEMREAAQAAGELGIRTDKSVDVLKVEMGEAVRATSQAAGAIDLSLERVEVSLREAGVAAAELGPRVDASMDVAQLELRETGQAAAEMAARADRSFDVVQREALESGAATAQATRQMAESLSRIEREFIEAANGAKRFGDTTEASSNRATASIRRVLGVAASLVGGFSLAFAGRAGITEIAAFEQGLVGVGKTTDILGSDLRELGVDVLDIASDVPVATRELLSIAQAAGQLGVRGAPAITKFTDTVAKLGTASDLQGDNAATTLARLLNITNESVESVDVLGSVIVRLGNEYAATESEIAGVATRVAQGTALFGVTAAQALALGATLKSLGIEAESGGTQVGLAFQAINKAVAEGGSDLDDFAKLAGRSSDEFAAAFRADKLEGFSLFLEGLNKLDGEQQILVLEQLGFEGRRASAVLSTLAGRTDILRATQASANEETRNATALEREASRGADTLSGDYQRLRNTITALLVSTGERGLVADLRSIVQGSADVVRVLAGLDGGFQGSEERARTLATALEAVAAGAAAFGAVKLLGFLGSLAGGIVAVSNPVTALALGLGVLVAAFQTVETKSERVERSTRELARALEIGTSATRDYTAAHKSLGDALDENDRRGAAVALRAQAAAVEEYAAKIRKLRGEGRVEIEVATSFAGISRADLQDQLTASLGGALSLDLSVDQKVSRELAVQVAESLATLPVGTVRDPFGFEVVGTKADQFEASIVAVRDRLQELVDRGKSASEAIREVFVAGGGVGASVPAAALLAALAEEQRALLESAAEWERASGQAERSSTARRLGYDAEGREIKELTDEQREAIGTLVEMAQKVRDETRLLQANADDRRLVAASIQAEAAARKVGLADVSKYVAAIEREIATQQAVIERRKEAAAGFAEFGVGLALQAQQLSAFQLVLERLPLAFRVASEAARLSRSGQADAAADRAAAARLAEQKRAVESLRDLRADLRFEISISGLDDGAARLASDLRRIREEAKLAGGDANAAAREFEELFRQANIGEVIDASNRSAVDAYVESVERAIRAEVAWQASQGATQDELRATAAELRATSFEGSKAFSEGIGAGARDFARFARDDFRTGVQLAQGAMESFSSAGADAFVAFASGAESGRAAFARFASSVLSDISRILARAALARLISSVVGAIAGGATSAADVNATALPGGINAPGSSAGIVLAEGGVVRGRMGSPLPIQYYAQGGIASTPQLAVFGEGRGAEAFVPLPDGRTIPVTMDVRGFPELSDLRAGLELLGARELALALGAHARALDALGAPQAPTQQAVGQAPAGTARALFSEFGIPVSLPAGGELAVALSRDANVMHASQVAHEISAAMRSRPAAPRGGGGEGLEGLRPLRAAARMQQSAATGSLADAELHIHVHMDGDTVEVVQQVDRSDSPEEFRRRLLSEGRTLAQTVAGELKSGREAQIREQVRRAARNR